MIHDADDWIAVENRARLARTTCGWALSGLDRLRVRNYWRDVHSPAISRRAGIHTYRHSPFDPVDPGLFEPVGDIALYCPTEQQLHWLSDVVYLDAAHLDRFLQSPSDPAVTKLLLGDIDLLVDQSTTYKSFDDNLWTSVDRTGTPIPLGAVPSPRWSVFFRDRPGVAQADSRAVLRHLFESWASAPGVLRLRTNLFEVPDMEAERAAGYPVKTHPLELQYQAWADLVVQDRSDALGLLALADNSFIDVIGAVHAYPVPAIYTFVFGGRPTLAGLRGFAAVESIECFGATNQSDERILEWMYGDVVHGSDVHGSDVHCSDVHGRDRVEA